MAAGLPRLTWHDLRHVAASAMIAAGVAPEEVSRLLGHANLATTLDVYHHQFERRKQADRARAAMEQAFGSALGALR